MYLAVPATRTGKAAGELDSEAGSEGEVEGEGDVAVAEIEDEEDDLLEAGGPSAKKH
jgi:hypothetical protein